MGEIAEQMIDDMISHGDCEGCAICEQQSK